MNKRGKGPAGPRPPKAWVAEPYQHGHVYYDPTADPGLLRGALIWFNAKHPNISCLFTCLFVVLPVLGVFAGYIWLITLAFLQSGGKANWWLFLGFGMLFGPFSLALLLLPFRGSLRSAFSKPSLPLGPSQTRKQKRRKRANEEEQPQKLFDPDDPAGFAQRIPYRQVSRLPKLRQPRNKGQKKEAQPNAQPQKSQRPHRRRITRKLRAATTQKLSEDDC